MMNRAAVLASLLVPLFAASAHADDTVVATGEGAAPGAVAPTAPTAPAPATGAPQNEDWSNVSHINGTPVPVGDRNRYLYSFKKTEIAVNPFSAFFGYYDAAVAHAVSQNVAVAGSFTGWSFSHAEHTGYQLTASVPIYFRRAFSGPYLEPGLIIREATTDYGSACLSSDPSCSSGMTHRWAGPQMLFGWQSTFDSGLTVQWAFGVAKHLATNWDESSDGTDVNGYFRVGYAF